MRNTTIKLFSIIAFQLSFTWVFTPASAGDFLLSSSCSGTGVIGCRAFDSMNDILELNEVGVQSPNRPLTNRKCQWNGGADNCYPAFDGGNCAAMDALGPRSQDTFETAKRWSPCYDENAKAARLTFWNDLKSGVQQLNAIEADVNVSMDQIWTQYEIKLSPEFFFNPEGTTSSKLYRIHRAKSGNCKDERFADSRFLKIYPDRVVIGPVVYCAGISYAGSETAVTLDPTRANNWIRITTHYDVTNSHVYFWAYDVTTNQLISEKNTNTHRGERFFFNDSTANIEGLNFLMHSTSHKPNPDKPSPRYWLRNIVLSGEPISPYPGNTPPIPETCISFTYSTWGTCQTSSTRIRSILSGSPLNCTGGNPVTTQSCVFGLSPPSPPLLIDVR